MIIKPDKAIDNLLLVGLICRGIRIINYEGREIIIMNFKITYLDDLNLLLTKSNEEKAAITKVTLVAGEWFSTLDPMDIQSLGYAFSTCQSLHALDLNSINLTTLAPECFDLFCRIFAQCPELDEINLSCNSLGNLNTQHLEILFNEIGQCKTLQKINLSNNELWKLDYRKIDVLGEVLISLEKMEELDLSDNRLGELGSVEFEALSTFISECKNLVSLDLGSNQLENLDDEDGFRALCKSLKNLSNLFNLKGMGSNGFNPEREIILDNILDEHVRNVFSPLWKESFTPSNSEEEEALIPADSVENDSSKRQSLTLTSS